MIYACMCVCVCVFVCAYIYIYIYIYIYMHIYIQIYVYTYTYTLSQLCVPLAVTCCCAAEERLLAGSLPPDASGPDRQPAGANSSRQLLFSQQDSPSTVLAQVSVCALCQVRFC